MVKMMMKMGVMMKMNKMMKMMKVMKMMKMCRISYVRLGYRISEKVTKS